MKLLLEPGRVIANRYEVKEFRGNGGMQQVYRATDRAFDRDVALKVPMNDSATKRFKRSAVISARVSHPNVARTLDYIDGEPAMLIEEFVNGYDLKRELLNRVKPLDPLLVARIAHYVSRGIRAAHSADIIHRDIKPANILVAGGFAVVDVKVTDFGIATMTEDVLVEAARDDESRAASTTMMGALAYMAPEAIENPKAATAASDIWSVGAMIYEMLVGKTPYGDKMAAPMNIGKGIVPARPAFLGANPQLSDLAIQLFELSMRCMSISAAERPTASNLVASIEQFAYNDEPRRFGVVNNILYNAYGFITDDETREPVFFHRNCVYGELPRTGSRVMYAKFDGSPQPRAFPVMKV